MKSVERFVNAIDTVNRLIGHAFSWSIVVLSVAVGYEVFVRYVLRAPTTWGYDASYMLYGLLFMTAGAYTLSRNGHVRGDFLYRNFSPRHQAVLDLLLYVLFFFPGIVALVYSGWGFFWLAFILNEHSSYSPRGLIVWPFKGLIPAVGVIMFVQGLAEVGRCILCLRAGAWPPRYGDVEETERAILEQARQPTPEVKR
jgi:TRAP-type mannitol/chloroaromatic compound transport system permease small subunit